MPRQIEIIAELCTNAYPFTPRKIYDYCRAAKYAGATAVKVQLYSYDHFPNEERAGKIRTEFPRDMIHPFILTAHDLGLRAGASVFSRELAGIAIHYGTDFIKLATREEGNEELFNATVALARDRDTMLYRSVGYPLKSRVKYSKNLRPANICTLACIPKYPTVQPHWWWLSGIGRNLPEPWGWSSHTQVMEDCVVAAALGASAIEKHLALNRHEMEAGWSLLPRQFKSMVNMINFVTRAAGK